MPGGPDVDFIIAKPILVRMGYTEAMIPPRFLQAENESDMWLEFLDSIAATPDFIGRIGRLPDFSNVPGEVNTTTCEPPFILGPPAPGGRHERDCCLDVNRSGVCDGVEFKNDPMKAKDLVLELTPGRPPQTLCNGKAFDVEVVVHNRGLMPVLPGSGYLHLLPVVPAAFGLTVADFYRPLPAIPSGGSATLRFEHLRYRDGSVQPEPDMLMNAQVCLPEPSGLDCTALRLPLWRPRPDSAECVADGALRVPSGPCRGLYVADRESGGCCLDVDRDGRCDDREWEQSRARPESMQISFVKNGPDMVIEESAPFSVSLTVRNRGPVAISGHDGFVTLVLPRRIVFPSDEAALFLALPDVAPGSAAVLTFRGLHFKPGPGDKPSQGSGFNATLCTRAGCVEGATVHATFRARDADKQLASMKSHPAGLRPPPVMIGADGSRTLSILDPRALVAIGQPAPDISAPDMDGHHFRLILLREKKNVLLLFCPQTRSEGCRARLASLKAARAELARLDVEVVVIADWTTEALADLRRSFDPGVSWVSDPGMRITSCYARRVAWETGILRPMIVIVDKNGKVGRAVDDNRGTQPPTADLLQSIKRMTAPAGR